MSVNIEQTASAKLPADLDLQKTASDLLNMVMTRCGCKSPACIDLMICEPETIRTLNRDFRGIDRVTDVLSFPNLECVVPGVLPEVNGADDLDPETGEINLGSIAICADQAFKQAEEYGHSIRREVAFLTAHSLLHLVGYDHMTDEEAEEMERIQEDMLVEIGITRD